MSIKNDIVWKIKDEEDGSISMTGTICYKVVRKIPKFAINEPTLSSAKREITDILTEKCFESGSNSTNRQDVYMHGYLDALDGFKPDSNDLAKKFDELEDFFSLF